MNGNAVVVNCQQVLYDVVILVFLNGPINHLGGFLPPSDQVIRECLITSLLGVSKSCEAQLLMHVLFKIPNFIECLNVHYFELGGKLYIWHQAYSLNIGEEVIHFLGLFKGLLHPFHLHAFQHLSSDFIHDNLLVSLVNDSIILIFIPNQNVLFFRFFDEASCFCFLLGSYVSPHLMYELCLLDLYKGYEFRNSLNIVFSNVSKS